MTRIALDRLPDGRLLLSVEAAAPIGSASALIAAFVTPETVARWWSAKLEVVAEPGGPYVAAFAGLGQTMRGEVLAYEPESRLEFSWSWDHEPDVPAYRVTVQAADEGEATRLRITHGSYADDEVGRAEAESHRAGWEYFLPRLLAEV